MRRGVSSGGGQSSLGYLFGGGEAPKPAAPSKPAATPKPAATSHDPPALNPTVVASDGATPKPTASASQADGKQVPAGIHSNASNNYFRADGQNSGNFLTDRPTTKVHAAPGGGSSLGYLFGGSGN